MWIGLDWMDGRLSYTAVTPRASLQSDANKQIDGRDLGEGGGVQNGDLHVENNTLDQLFWT